MVNCIYDIINKTGITEFSRIELLIYINDSLNHKSIGTFPPASQNLFLFFLPLHLATFFSWIYWNTILYTHCSSKQLPTIPDISSTCIGTVTLTLPSDLSPIVSYMYRFLCALPSFLFYVPTLLFLWHHFATAASLLRHSYEAAQLSPCIPPSTISHFCLSSRCIL